MKIEFEFPYTDIKVLIDDQTGEVSIGRGLQPEDIEITFEGRFASIVITRGEGTISTNVGDFEVKEGETYIIPASIDVHRYLATKRNLDIVISLPPQY